MRRSTAAAILLVAASFALAGCDTNISSVMPQTPTPAIQITGVRSVNSGQAGSSLLSSPTNSSVLINTLADAGMQLVVNYGTKESELTQQTSVQTSTAGMPVVTALVNLHPDTTYFYSVAIKKGADFLAAPTKSFHTQRSANESFSFGVQGDSHPEREGKMFDPSLYEQGLSNAAKANLDFYLMMGDDFSIDKLIEDGSVSQETVNQRYLLQRTFLDKLGSSTPVFTVNGNHEEAAKYLLDGSSNNPAVFAGNARNLFFPLADPNDFYSGDNTQVEGIGFLHDYYAFTWGDALFVVIDPYWHSDTMVDNAPSTNKKTEGGEIKGKGKKQSTTSTPEIATKRNLWDNTLGKDQYDWLVQTLSGSTAKYKFVFTHHVLGTGRGGVEQATLYEWGGYDKNGEYGFDTQRPDWSAPIQKLMAENNVTIFFQGHDHLFAQQELDGVTYQTVPCPADPTNTAFNADAYTSGTVLPNSGFLKIDVADSGVTVNYIATGGERNGQSIYSYTVSAGKK